MIGAALLTCLAAPVRALDISGASTLQPVVSKLAELFTQKGGEPVKVAGGGSGAGVKNALAGTSQIGMVSRGLSDSEKASLKHTTIGLDALAILVHESNTLSSLTKDQVKKLYLGQVTNWRDLGGPDLPVLLVSKEVGRSTLELFEHYSGMVSPDRPNAGGKPVISKQAIVIGANIEAVTLVGGLPGAVGYASFGDAQTLKAANMPIKMVKLDNTAPSTETVLNRSYPIVRELNLVYKDETPAVRAFLDLALSAEGQALLKAAGFVAMTR
jgi:phosphate transport system substrate-binding protein